MSTGVIILIVAVVVVVAVLAAAAMTRLPRLRSRRLQQRFGPEYQRELARHEGDRTAAERELEARVRRAEKLDIQPLDATRRERFLGDWNALQEQFVDAPAQSVVRADQLLNEVLREQGYPEEDRYAALSVHHARALSGYRASRDAAARAAGGRTGDGTNGETTTEELRQAFVDTRGAFDLLVRGDEGSRGGPVPSPRPVRSGATTEESV